MKGFNFGLETEYILYDKAQLRALWCEEIDFQRLHDNLMEIDFSDLPGVAGLDEEEAHARISPFVVEGYHLKDETGKATSMLPKGVEIRTPVCSSISECLNVHQTLHQRMKISLDKLGYLPVSLSHHPERSDFYAERRGRRHDFWRWALEVMSTYGPDINISYPDEIEKKIFGDLRDFEKKVNYYAPAMTALTLASPFKGGRVEMRGRKTILSQRTFKRSTFAPAIEPHLNENGRMEFKFFEMAASNLEYEAYFLLCLVLSLSDDLKGRAADQERIYSLGEVAQEGLEAHGVLDVLEELRQKAGPVLEDHGFDPAPLQVLWKRLDTGLLPAHELIHRFGNEHDLANVLESRACLC